LDKFEIEGPWISKEYFEWDLPRRAIGALQMIQARALQFSFAAGSQELLQLLGSTDEVEELTVRLRGEGVIEGFFIGLQATSGKPVCPNLKVLDVQLWGIGPFGPLRKDIIKWCKRTLINRRHAGHPLGRCSIWTSSFDRKRLNLTMLNNGRISIQEEVSD
jgi:hypothetical protein